MRGSTSGRWCGCAPGFNPVQLRWDLMPLAPFAPGAVTNILDMWFGCCPESPFLQSAAWSHDGRRVSFFFAWQLFDFGLEDYVSVRTQVATGFEGRRIPDISIPDWALWEPRFSSDDSVLLQREVGVRFANCRATRRAAGDPERLLGAPTPVADAACGPPPIIPNAPIAITATWNPWTWPGREPVRPVGPLVQRLEGGVLGRWDVGNYLARLPRRVQVN